jgi:pteridine reductase
LGVLDFSMADIVEQRVALVTGGAARVGKVIVRELAAHGYRVAIHANQSLDRATEFAAELNASGHEAAAFAAELRDEDATRAMIDRVCRHFGRLDLLVNNAAIWAPTPLADAAADDVRRFFEVNTVSTFVCCQHAGLLMAIQPEGGAIINIGDWATVRPYRNYAPYFASKGAIPTLTRAFAVELAPRVRVNAILPGPVMLPDELSPEVRERAIAGTLVRRAGRPEHVAQAVLFLAQNDFVTGVCLPVDGGRSIGQVD